MSFEELVTMLKSEDKQLGKETSEPDVVNTVLVAAHGNSSQNQGSTGNISFMIPSVSSVPVPLPQNQIGANQSQFVPFSSTPQQHQYFPPNFRFSNNRGRGGRGSYYPKGPCDICGRSNHSTNYCYYRPNNMPFDVSNSQWRGYTNFSQSFPWNPMMPGVPQYTMPLYQGYPTQPSRFPAQNSGGYRFSGGFRSPSGPALPMQHSQSISQMPSPKHLTHQPAFAGFTESFGMPSSFSGPSGSCYMQQTPSASSVVYNADSYNNSASQPWYFDSGATNHITNNLHNLNLEHSQPSNVNEGVLVGNGNTLQVTHTGKGLLPTPATVFNLSHILHTPHITHNLLSVHQFAKDNQCLLIFYSNGLVIQDKYSHRVLYKGPCHRGLYPIQNHSKSCLRYCSS